MVAEMDDMSREEPEINLADVKAYEAWLRALAWQILGNSDDVDEVVQDVWLANLRRKEPKRLSRAWLGAVTRNLSLTQQRRRSQRIAVERKAAREEELDETVQSAIERVSLYRRLLQWILEMEEPYRETLLLRFALDPRSDGCLGHPQLLHPGQFHRADDGGPSLFVRSRPLELHHPHWSWLPGRIHPRRRHLRKRHDRIEN